MHPIVAVFSARFPSLERENSARKMEVATRLQQTLHSVRPAMGLRPSNSLRAMGRSPANVDSNALNSPLYAARFVEVVGRSRTLGRSAGVAVSACRANAAMAERFCLVRPGPASLGRSVAIECGAARPLAAVHFLLAYLCGVFGIAATATGSATRWRSTATCRHWLRPCCCIGFSLVLGLYFGALRPGRHALVRRGHWQHAARAGWRAHPVDRTGTRRCTDHERALGPTRLLAGRQRSGEPTRAMDWRLRHQLLARGRECAVRMASRRRDWLP